MYWLIHHCFAHRFGLDKFARLGTTSWQGLFIVQTRHAHIQLTRNV